MTTTTNPSGWLTARRLRAHAIILAACLWSVYVWDMATPGLRDRSGNLKGTDFLHFYTLGTLALEHRANDLYDMNAQATVAGRRVPPAAGIRYLPLYPPQVSMGFAPLARLSYGWALGLWWAFSAAVYGVCCLAIWLGCPNLQRHGGLIALLAIAFPAFFHLIAWGQTSALALACFTLAFLLMRSRRDFLAGLGLGCLIFKPQLGLAAAVLFVTIGAWKLVAGAAASAAVQLGAGVLYYGVDPLRQWVLRLVNVRSVVPWLEPKPYQTHSLRTFWSMLVPWADVASALYVLTAVMVLALTVGMWKRSQTPLALRYSALLLATVLIAPHLTVYDLVILAPMFLLMADWMVGQASASSPRWLGTVLYLVYTLPLLGLLARWTHVQLAVIAMAGCLYLVWRASARAFQAPEAISS